MHCGIKGLNVFMHGDPTSLPREDKGETSALCSLEDVTKPAA